MFIIKIGMYQRCMQAMKQEMVSLYVKFMKVPPWSNRSYMYICKLEYSQIIKKWNNFARFDNIIQWFVFNGLPTEFGHPGWVSPALEQAIQYVSQFLIQKWFRYIIWYVWYKRFIIDNIWNRVNLCKNYNLFSHKRDNMFKKYENE